MLWSRTGNRKKASKDNADPEAQLVERLKQRDEPAFLELYDRHRRSVYWFLVHMTGSVVIAEDLTQGVFVAILEKICSGTMGQFDSGKGALEGFTRAALKRARQVLQLGYNKGLWILIFATINSVLLVKPMDELDP